jgi:hypothetical protein
MTGHDHDVRALPKRGPTWVKQGPGGKGESIHIWVLVGDVWHVGAGDGATALCGASTRERIWSQWTRPGEDEIRAGESLCAACMGKEPEDA